jgi:hypothetical protein
MPRLSDDAGDRHGVGKVVRIDRVGHHWSPRDLLMDALDGIRSVSGDEDDRVPRIPCEAT